MGSSTVILLPGLLCDDAVWRDQCNALSYWRCVVPSYGTLSSINSMAEHVLAEAPTQSFSLVGHSMGGRIALEIMRLAPHRVDRLALADTGFEALAPGAASVAEKQKRHQLLALARADGMRAMGQQWAKGMVHPARLDTPVFTEILGMIERKTPEVFESQITALLNRPDARQVFLGVTCPTLIFCGRQDVWSPFERHEEMKALLPAARLVAVEDAGHMCPMEQPQRVSQALLDWLSQ